MITTNNPYNRKVGFNICNNFFKLLEEDKLEYLNLLFRRNEREALGRRILIMIYVLEGFSGTEIINKLKCGRATITAVNKELKRFEGNKENLLKFLIKVYYEQFPKKEKRVGGSRTVSGTKHLLGLDRNNKDRNFVPLHTK